MLIDVHGVGYWVAVPARLLKKAAGDDCTVFTSLQVRQDSLSLFGFETNAERRLFDWLVSVSGVGPKLGLAILSLYTASEVESHISSANVTAFQAVSGIGKKNAQRIIVELQSKIGEAAALSFTGEASTVVSGLQSLGFSVQEIREVLSQVDQSGSAEEQVKAALRLLRKG